VSGLYSGALASQQCGCEAKCSDGFIFHDIKTKCYDSHSACRIHSDDNKCEVICSKKSDEKTTETVQGTCHEVFFHPVSLNHSPRSDR
jgi:hypothetical protein